MNHSYLFVLACMSLLLVACGAAPPAETPREAPNLVWPAAPEQPRIRFVRTIQRPADIGVSADALTRLWGALKGERPKRIRQPYGIAKDAAGRLYVADTTLEEVHVFDPSGPGYRRFPDQTLPDFKNPIDIAVAADGRVFVSDSEAGRVHVFTDGGRQFQQDLGAGQLRRPTGLAINRLQDELIVADTLAGRIVVYDLRTLVLERTVGEEGEGERASHDPTAVAVAPDGTVYVTDSLNFRVQVLTPDYAFARSFGAAGDGPGHFSRPKGIATDSDGNVYVVDALFDNVQIFDSRGRLLMDFGGPGKAPGTFWLPNAIYIDAQDRIYVSDSYNQRVQVFDRVKPAGTAQ